MSYAACAWPAYDAVRSDFLATGDPITAVARRARIPRHHAHAILDDVFAGLRAGAEAERLAALPPSRRTTLRVPSRTNPETP